MDYLALFVRFAADVIILILLYDFFSQPFRFYGMDPLTRIVWKTSRWICPPFEWISRRIIPLVDRDPAPLFTVGVVVILRGLIYALVIAFSTPTPTVILSSITVSFVDLFMRFLIPMLLFLLYLDIQLSRHMQSFIGNILVMMIHDIVKLFILQVRRILPSYQPWVVFVSCFVILGLCQWLLLLMTMLPFKETAALDAIPAYLLPIGMGALEQPFLLLPAVFIKLASSFLWGIFILLLLHMIAGFSGMDPYDRISLVLGIIVQPWLEVARRLFPFARFGTIDFSIGILLLIVYFLLAMLENLLKI